MRKLFSALLVTSSVILLLAACGGGEDKKAAEQNAIPETPKASKNSEALNQSFAKLLTSYYEVKDALVASDTAKANTAATALGINADSLLVDEIKDDSSGMLKTTARNFATTLSGSAKGLLGEKDIEAKRKEFQMISEALYDLTRTIRYDQQKIYHQYCPMAFNDAGAYWLSKDEEIKNPYFGSKMLSCGETRDSLNF